MPGFDAWIPLTPGGFADHENHQKKMNFVLELKVLVLDEA